MKKKKVKEIGITALYERLSRDDDGDGDSNSIVHQKQMLEAYAKEHGFVNLRHYTDDGWSGASFDRPAWNELVAGVKAEEITTVIVKDLSRVGRDHLQVGFFTDILFREKEVHFIAIGNGIDSNDQQSSEFAPFLNIMNEWYVRDTSKKIKSVLKARGMSGSAHTSNCACYGYKKDPENPDKWVIDEEAASVVREIFQMCVDGKGPYEIARCLAERKVERPSYYLAKRGLGNHQSDCDYSNPYTWRGHTVATILERPEYTGCTVNFRTYKNSYKDKKIKKADKSDWVIFEGTQEPIIDKETWSIVQNLRKHTRRTDSLGEANPLTGKVFCGECGSLMYNHRRKNGRVRVYYTSKGERRESYSKPEDCYACSKHMIDLKKHIHDSANGLDYTLVNDHYLPNLTVAAPAEHPTGRWGRLHKMYLKEQHPIRYNQLLLSGELGGYLAKLDKQTEEQLALIIRQMQEAEGVTEALKAADQLEWVRRMNNIRNRAEEIVYNEIVYK